MIYRIQTGHDSYFVRFANNLCEEEREDGMIAEGRDGAVA